jgi:hypothetical protein
VRKAGTESGYVWRIIVNAHIDEVRRPGRRRERHVPELPEAPAPPEAVTDGPGGEVRAALAALPPACAPPSCCGTQILAFQIAGGQWVVIQVPVPLGWDSAELAKFAGGVQVLAAAQQGRG